MFSARLQPAIKAVYPGSNSLNDPEENQSSIRLLEINDGENTGPTSRTEVDISNNTRIGCLVAISTSAVLAVICFAYGIHIFSTSNAAPTDISDTASLSPSQVSALIGAPRYTVPVSVSGAGQETLILALNIIITLLNEGMAYAHSISLRWALYNEDRLVFNSPLRLFTDSKHCLPNRWYINMVSLFCLILSYAASSVLVVMNDVEADRNSAPVINATSILALALAMIGQVSVSIWCITSRQHAILSWSSNPLNNTLAAIRGGRVSHRKGRCMISVHQRDIQVQGIYPLTKQGSIYQAQGTVKYILALLWILVLLSIGWVVSIVIVSRSLAGAGYSNDDPYAKNSSCWKFGFNWNMDGTPCSMNYVTLFMTPAGNIQNPGANKANYSFAGQTVLALLFTCLIQGSQTVALHCVEIFVNMAREEAIWRRAYSADNDGHTRKSLSSGAKLSMNPFLSAILSWEYIILFILKVFLHWIMGQSLLASVTHGFGETAEQISFSFQFNMIYSRLIIYATLATVLAGFATYLVFRRHGGCQPATMGHIQTIADLIDDWEVDKTGRLWWGDATSSSIYDGGAIIRHAGTSKNKDNLRPIQLNSRYAG